MSFTGKNGQL